MVLLKNECGVLPLKKGCRVALFGKAQIDYVRGGGGSGEVTTSYTRNIYEGMKLKEEEGKLQVFDELSRFYEEDVKEQYAQGKENGKTCLLYTSIILIFFIPENGPAVHGIVNHSLIVQNSNGSPAVRYGIFVLRIELL